MQTEPLGNSLLVVHFGELWLRGKNRNLYISALVKNINAALAGMRYALRRQYDRIIIEADANTLRLASGKLANVFGISNYEIAHVVEPRLESIASLAADLAEGSGANSIKIEAHRSDKRLPFDSIGIMKAVADAVKAKGIEPRLKGFGSRLFVNATEKVAYVYMDKNKGLGGLPVGSEGKCVVLLSGGIDSPVAAWYAMKRGLEPVYLHVHAFRDNAEAMRGKVQNLLGVLARYSPRYSAYFVPSYMFEAASASARADRYALVILKNFMLRLAQAVAKKEHAGAIVTGESLGQVASQTLENLYAESQGVKLPILRPLIGFDKEEIIGIAKRIGTYEESIKSYADVCSIVARNPKTKCDPESIKSLASRMKMGVLVRRSLSAASFVPNY
ncbi:MAG: tRNA uracil 4-sulfurtransferase ThiI [Candidatus Micrarchaeia archaeon]